jgi:ribonuclease E
MTKRMLIDATHAEETRVVVLDGNRLEDFDVETASRRQLKGNIYLAKVVRVEPSLQAAFVEYGGNRHGFLAFGEIHPDYYQIPVADRQRLLELQEEEARAAEQEEEEDEADDGPFGTPSDESQPQPPEPSHAMALEADQATLYAEQAADEAASAESAASNAAWNAAGADDGVAQQEDGREAEQRAGGAAPAFDETALGPDSAPEMAEPAPDTAETEAARADEQGAFTAPPGETADEPMLGTRVQHVVDDAAPAPEIVGGSDQAEEPRGPRMPSRYLRNYKIQEVIRRRQILLIQVVKEERGTKGAALTTYISLAGRFCVLMPNSPRGGGISRKITSAADRRRLKEVTQELDIPRGMGLIVRTAGAARPKPEIKRDCEYLLRLWDEIRDHTMQSVAPALIYEEASLIKRAIRDVYSRDVDEILVDGEEGWKAARDFMRMLMPTHVKKVQLWRDGGAPLFAKQQVEAQLDAMLVPTVQLRSGGYLVINQTEALVAIDVNSGRSTRERGIEETALRTNLEAADEVARQLRLRDLAGLIVIDFIDMESKKHNAAVERRMKEALRDDRARIQIGSISHFGLLEMSRQRLRPSVAETSQTACPHCGGTGHVRSTDSAALHVLRAIEDEGGKRRAAEIMVHVAGAVAMFILNHKRQRLMEIEQRTGMRICFSADDDLLPGQTRIDRLRPFTPQDLPPPAQTISQTQARMDASEAQTASYAAAPYAESMDDEDGDEDAAKANGAASPEGAASGPEDNSEEGQRRRRKRRRRRGGRRDDSVAGAAPMPPDAEQPDLEEIAFPGAVRVMPPAVTPRSPVAAPNGSGASPGNQAGGMEAAAPALPVPGHDEAAEAAEENAKPKIRSRRGGRRRSRSDGASDNTGEATLAYAGPTPADPFGSVADIFDILEQAEQRVTPSAPQPPVLPAAEPEPPAADPVADLANPPAIAVSEAVAPVDPADVAASTEPVVGPAIKPVVIGSDPVVVERKRGWWRR